MKHVRTILASCGALPILFALACDKEPSGPGVVRDTIPPLINLENRGLTSDGVVKLRATWTDPEKPLVRPPFSLTVDGQRIDNTWIVQGGDGTYVDYEESVSVLLRAGAHEFIATVADSAGNTASDTLHISLPYLTRLGSIVADVSTQGPLVACGDSTRVFLGGLRGLLAIDALRMTYEVVNASEVEDYTFGPTFLTCATDERALYSANGLQRFDVATRTWSERRSMGNGYAIIQSKRSPGELFVGTSYGLLTGYDRASGVLRREIRLPRSTPNRLDAIVAIAAAPNDERIFVTQFTDSTYVFDANWDLQFSMPHSLSSIAITPNGMRGLGISLFIPGVVEFNPRSGQTIRTFAVPNAWRIDLRNDGEVAVVTTASRGGSGYNYLYDLRGGGFRELVRFDPGTWYAGGAAWLSHIKRLVVFTSEEGTKPDHFDVYLDRS